MPRMSLGPPLFPSVHVTDILAFHFRISRPSHLYSAALIRLSFGLPLSPPLFFSQIALTSLVPTPFHQCFTFRPFACLLAALPFFSLRPFFHARVLFQTRWRRCGWWRARGLNCRALPHRSSPWISRSLCCGTVPATPFRSTGKACFVLFVSVSVSVSFSFSVPFPSIFLSLSLPFLSPKSFAHFYFLYLCGSFLLCTNKGINTKNKDVPAHEPLSPPHPHVNIPSLLWIVSFPSNCYFMARFLSDMVPAGGAGGDEQERERGSLITQALTTPFPFSLRRFRSLARTANW